MTLLELLNKANRLYPDGHLATYYDARNGDFVDNPRGGDGLARFIVIELRETFDADADDNKQLEEAVRNLIRARNDIDAVIASLEEGL